ncbi:glycoside hydrolase family 3 protein [Streptomyces tsukubensis]|uniref:Glycosyl hydrolase n=1 Tax=Streptomyces tsukubensis TaxID=83656 RepID=A0A1V4A5F4_9ACTN|nr:glycoside hydrolase family 3 C-terminal domain-containing protein [Streptomyces tsukubensis]OON76652.1 glycosyl hydrolase [Streptomyces tsukubensis]QFR93382.1 glycosyl hydrolase [Streptomyces tsukubensis]
MAGASITPERQAAHEAAAETALGKLDLDTKARLLAGQDFWSLPALPEIGLDPLVMSDGPIGVRGVRSTSDDPSIALPSPTALAATWDPALARRTGALLAQEARRKGVHVLLAPTVNLHRSPLGGRHFEAYSEDPYLTGAIGTGYVQGVQSGGVGTTVKHFVANDAETDRFTVDNRIAPRPLRELYLAPFEAIVENAHPWGIMTAYNTVNGTSMTEHRYLVGEVLRGEWHFDGFNVSDWTAARSTVGDALGGLDVAMPGPRTVYGEALAEAVRAGEVEESVVDAAVRRVLLLAARVGALEGVDPAVTQDALPAPIDGEALAREIAARSFVLVRNEGGALPIDPEATTKVALIGGAARDARVLGGGSATVFPAHIVSPLDGLTAALPADALTYEVGADPGNELDAAGKGFDLRAVCRDSSGDTLATVPAPDGRIQWMGSDLPEGVTFDALHSIELTGTLTPRESGTHTFGTRGIGGFLLTVDGAELYTGEVAMGGASDPFEAFFGKPTERGRVELTEGTPVDVSLTCEVAKPEGLPIQAVGFTFLHQNPVHDADELIAAAAEAARAADTAVVLVATTESVESEGFDRRDLRLPGRQDDLVRAVAAANPRTVVVVNSGSPVEMPWRDEVAAVLLSWFPGQEGGAALADVLLGGAEPGGRLPTTWPAVLADVPVSETTPTDGELHYDEGVFIGYRAWDKAGTAPAYSFGHGLGYTDWSYDSVTAHSTDEGVTATVLLRNSGPRAGRETVQIYLAPDVPSGSGTVRDGVERPARWLGGFATVEAPPGGSVEAEVRVPRRAFEIWDEDTNAWTTVSGTYLITAGRSLADLRVSATTHV